MMTLKIKVSPEDFVVEEVCDLPIREKGKYGVYVLQKRGWNTLDALRAISKRTKLASRLFAYGGKKDRYGLTSQTITIHDQKDRSFTDKNFSIRRLGFCDRPMDPYFIKANRFRIVVRKLTKPAVDQALEELARVQAQGFPNYFDDQRFGSYDPLQGFLGEKILKRHWNGALKSYLLSIHPEDKTKEKQRKTALGRSWKDWKACAGLAETGFEKMAFPVLRGTPDDLQSLISRIPREELFMAASAYQSYLWNEMVRRLIMERCPPPFKMYPGKAGDYVFPGQPPRHVKSSLSGLILPLAAAKASVADPGLQNIYTSVLNEHNLRPALFKRVKIREAEFKPSPRPILVKPESLEWNTRPDSVYPGHIQLNLSVQLPRGCYATMLIKAVFSRDLAALEPRLKNGVTRPDPASLVPLPDLE